MRKSYRKILVIGSGPIKIGEAAEFDYSGSQALKALREEGIKSVIMNPNVATVQTTHTMADRVYLLPLRREFAEKVILEEKPDGVMFGFGGQSALNLGYDMYKSGFLKKHGVDILGTHMEGINDALSRSAFHRLMEKRGIPVPPSGSAKNMKEALRKAKEIGYPVMMRVSFNLGGRGSFVAGSEEKLAPELDRAFAQSKVSEVLIEKYLDGWKELEYEIVRDADGNSAAVACLENLDPMGVHTGESTVVAPQQTLDNQEYQEMRSVAIRVAEAIGLVGECNVQFALDMRSRQYYVIETNPRMSRSSALASKVTGYPIAYVSAKIALGYRIYEIRNSVSKATNAFFEPSLDYITVKVPRWDLGKFERVDQGLSSEMKSIGEVMAIGRSFIEALDKAVGMLDIGEQGLCSGRMWDSGIGRKEALKAMRERKPYWFLYAAKAFKEGASVDDVWKASKVDKFFLKQIFDRVKLADQGWKKSGNFAIKRIDTLAGEAPADANYLYTTSEAIKSDIEPSESKKLLILGAGCFRIGVSVEFDYSAVNLAAYAKKHFSEVSMLNYNPETVSTDWNVVDRLYFDSIATQTVSSILEKGRGDAQVAVFAAGQIGNSISSGLAGAGVKLFGHSYAAIDACEDRNRFSAMLERLGVSQPEWASATSRKEIMRFAESVGFPILVRPSYVLSGSAMSIANNLEELERCVRNAARLSAKHPVILSRYIGNSIEAEMDCVTDGKGVYGITLQHVEEAGVHSGDSTMFTPNGLGKGAYSKMKGTALALSNELGSKGPFNIQFVVEKEVPKVIELNMRCSRSMPFSSKSVGKDIMNVAVDAIASGLGRNGFYEPHHASYAVKSPQFSWTQLRGAYPALGPEMRSTGESAALGSSFDDALLKSWIGVQPNFIAPKGSVAILYSKNPGAEIILAAEKLSKWFDVKTISDGDLQPFEAISQDRAVELMRLHKVGITVTEGSHIGFDYKVRRGSVDLNVPLVLNGRLGLALAAAMERKGFVTESLECLEMGRYWEGRQKAGSGNKRNIQ